MESVHQARIATRRLRAALEVVGAGSDEVKLCRFLGRRFGRVRELDAARDLVSDFASRVPAAAAVLGLLGSEIEGARLRARRRLVKELEGIRLRPLARAGARRHVTSLKFWTDWREGLITALAMRARALREALNAAPTVYMPNRVHRVRIALKKLRYTLEIAEAAGTSVDQRVMRDARKIQDLLGRMHDLQTTRGLIRRVQVSGRRITDEKNVLDAVITSECTALHTTYLSRRDRLRAVCDYTASLIVSGPAARAGRAVLRALPVVGIAALPVAVWRLGVGGVRETSTT